MSSPGTGSVPCFPDGGAAGASADGARAEGASIENRYSLLVGSAIFAVLIVRIAIPGTEPGEGGTLQAAALIGGSLGALLTVSALRFRLRVPSVHLAALTPILGATAVAVIVEGSAVGTGRVAAAVTAVRDRIEVGNLLLEDVVVFAVAFWVIAAFFVHATVEGSPRIAVLAPLVAALAVTVLEPAPTSPSRIVVDVGLVAAVLVAAALDERSAPTQRFQHVARLATARRTSRFASALLTATALAVAIGAAAVIGTVTPERQLFLAPAVQGETIVYRAFADVHQRLTEIRDDELFTIDYASTSAVDEYVRLFTLPAFEGTGFGVGPGGEQTSGTDHIDQQIEITGSLGGTWLPAVNGATAVVDTASTLVAGGVRGTVRSGIAYRALSTGPVRLPATSRLVPPASPGTLTLDGLGRVSEITRAASAIAGGGSPLERAIALETHFRGGTYRIPDTPQNADIGAWLLDADHPLHLTGYCEQFAVGMAVAARAIGMPSRVVVGFAPGRAAGTTVIYTGAEAHAWVEVWLDGAGWVMFDPTPRAGVDAFGPTYRLDGDPVATATTVPASQTTAPSIVAAPVAQEGGDTRVWPALTGVVIVGLVLLVAAGTAVDRTRRRRAATAGNVVAAWDHVLHRLTDLGRRPARSATPLEIAEETAAELQPLARTYTKVTYGGAPLADEERTVAVDSMLATERALRANSGVWRRFVAATGLGALRGFSRRLPGLRRSRRPRPSAASRESARGRARSE